MTMSDSWISLNPLIEEPSSLPTPRLNSSAPRDVDGIVMCCSAPSTSTNWRSIHRIPSVSIRLSTDATVNFFDFAGLLAEIAIAFPPGRSHRSVRCLGRNLNIYKLFRHEIVRMAEILIENETMFGGPAGGSYIPSARQTRTAIRWRDPPASPNYMRRSDGTRRLHQAPRVDGLRREHVYAGRPQRREGGATGPPLDWTIA